MCRAQCRAALPPAPQLHAEPTFRLPRQDVHAPDLYIPLMAVWAYSLLVAGTQVRAYGCTGVRLHGRMAARAYGCTGSSLCLIVS
jgi:hypothetical protein